MNVTVIGIDGRSLTSWAADRLAAATLVVGGARHLEAVPVPTGAARHVLTDVAAGVAAVRAHTAGPVAVLASGDPGFFGVLRLLREHGVDVEVTPAVSSVSAAFALAGESWDDALVVSAHGRELRRAVNACRAHPKVAVLTAPGSGPAEIGGQLLGWPRRLVVAERIGTPAQRVTTCAPEIAAAREWDEPNVVLALADTVAARGWLWPPRQAPPRWALPERAYDHRDGMVTKSEVRALALAHLGPGVGDLVWDVGCGSGSVAAECARFGAAVVAVDRNADQCARAHRNAAAHGVHVRVVHAEAPGCLAELPDPDAVFVGGGGVEVVAAAAARGARTVVAALAALDRVAAARDALRASSYDVGGAALNAVRLADLPDGTTRLDATNPVFVVWGHR